MITRLLVVCVCLGVLVAPAGAHPGHAHTGDYTLHVPDAVPTAAVAPAGTVAAATAEGAPAATVGVARGDPLTVVAATPAGVAASVDLRDPAGRTVASTPVIDGSATVPGAATDLAPGSYALVLRADGVDRDAVGVLIAGVGVGAAAVEGVAAPDAPLAVHATVHGATAAVESVTVVLDGPTATTVVADRVRSGLYAATVPAPEPGPYRATAVVRDAAGDALAVSAPVAFDVTRTDDGRAVRAVATDASASASTDAASAPVATPTPTPAAADGDGADAPASNAVRAALVALAALAVATVRTRGGRRV